MADGSFAVWDPARNYWKSKGEDGNARPAAYVFSPTEVWDGLQREDGTWLCNGLIRDWAGWQKEKGTAFSYLESVLEALSSPDEEKLVPGELTRISLDDVRDMPTLKMPYGQEVAVVHASSGMRRIVSLAYFLVWCWEEHLRAKKLLGERPSNKTTFLIDEVEAHLHPKWQRSIIPALMNIMDRLMHQSVHDVHQGGNDRSLPLRMQVCLNLIYKESRLIGWAFAKQFFCSQMLFPAPNQKIRQGNYPPHARRRVYYGHFLTIRHLQCRHVSHIIKADPCEFTGNELFFIRRRKSFKHGLQVGESRAFLLLPSCPIPDQSIAEPSPVFPLETIPNFCWAKHVGSWAGIPIFTF